MAITPMQKIAIFFPIAERDKLITYLQDKGSVQLLDVRETSLVGDVNVSEAAGGTEPERIASEIKRAIDYLAEFEEKGGILGGFGGGKVVVREDEFKKIIEEFDYKSVLSSVEDLETKRNQLRTRRNQLESFIDRLEPWEALDVPFEDLQNRKDVGIAVGVLSDGRTPQSLAGELSEVSETFRIEIIKSTERQAYLVIFYHLSEEEEVQEVLRRNDFEIQSFDTPGLARDLIAEARREIASIDDELQRIADQAKQLVQHKPKLMIAYDYFTQEAKKTYAQSLIGTTKQVGIIEGWLRKSDYKDFVSDVSKRLDSVEIVNIEPEEGEEPPIELLNKPIVRPFEVITEMYGMPHSKEVDPTPLAAPFFALFFGFCITDAGYGIVLVILSLLLLKYLKTGRKLLWLIFAGGLTTILMGAITGGWFGLTEETMPAWLGFVGSLRRTLMQFDPMENPMIMFGLAIALGFIQVTFGLLIAMVENFRRRDFAAGIFEQLTWIVLLWCALLWGASKFGVLSPAYVSTFKTGAIVAACGIIGFTNRATRNPVKRIGAGLYRLYGATSFLGDILSYTRLLALGLATGGIAMVINVVAQMAKGIPFVGYPAMLAVLAGGHAFNIAVNALGGFVHSARLQYVEFYPKFFEGGGKPFTPFRKEMKFTRLVEEKAS